jgi:hypothetical protein
MISCPKGSCALNGINTPIFRTSSAGCANVTGGHAEAAPSAAMNARLFV